MKKQNVTLTSLIPETILVSLSGQNLSISASSFAYGAGYLDNNSFIYYPLTANYYGAVNDGVWFDERSVA